MYFFLFFEEETTRTFCFNVPLLLGNSRVDERINYWLNGSMTKNVKDGLCAGMAGWWRGRCGAGRCGAGGLTQACVRPVCSPSLRCGWNTHAVCIKRNGSIKNICIRASCSLRPHINPQHDSALSGAERGHCIFVKATLSAFIWNIMFCGCIKLAIKDIVCLYLRLKRENM